MITRVQKQLNALMPWIGLYIASASAVCTLAMAADAFNGFRCKKLWFPCKYFSLNAVSLTLLAVAMKLPMDLNTILLYKSDWLAKLGSLVFLSTAMANFITSLGFMSDKEIIANVVALGILVITVVANVLCHVIQLKFLGAKYIIDISFPTISMLLLLARFTALAITVPTIKRSLERKYKEKHKEALRAEEMVQRRETIFNIDNQRREMMKYWVMAETSSPQFVMARSVVCTTLTLFFLLPAITLVIFHIQSIVQVKDLLLAQRPTSVYGGYTRWILVIQSIGVVVGLIAPMFRWFVAVGFKCSTTNFYNFRKEFKIEAHWIQTLVDCRESFSGLNIRKDKYYCWKCLHDAKWYFLTICIGVQTFVVLVSKLLVLVSALLIRPIVLCFIHIKIVNNDQSGDDINTNPNLSRYVVLLEGESELPRRIFRDICCRADNMIQTGRKKQPKCLINLLTKFVHFNGVREFDSNQIPSLHSHSQKPPNCWTLPMVTLTSIAIVLPNIITDRKSNQLLGAVSEGLYFAKLIEKYLDRNGDLTNISNAADVVWVGVELYKKWQDKDLQKADIKGRTHKETLQKLSDIAEKTVTNFMTDTNNFLVQDPLNWPVKVIAANSMYRITQTILLADKDDHLQTDEELFERLSIMISDILAACLTNLVRVIILKCHISSIKDREQNIRQAATLLGESKEILEILEQRELPSLDPEKAANIEEWRAFMKQDLAATSDEIANPNTNDEHVSIKIEV
ncbi:hypothetical protein DH2020_019275 [Rehmannia glutinosa]|uniref:Uncharacterized protein n=1 Tax=Rehmannia glutinosa TaxID=99300 RepID=A0ABR0WLC5_REHGL